VLVLKTLIVNNNSRDRNVFGKRLLLSHLKWGKEIFDSSKSLSKNKKIIRQHTPKSKLSTSS